MTAASVSLSKDLRIRMNSLKKEIENELVRKYLSGIEGVRKAEAKEMTQVISKRILEIMMGKKEGMISDFVSDIRLAGLSVGKRLNGAVVSRMIMVFDRILNDMTENSIKVMVEVVDDYFRWTRANDLPQCLVDRILGLIGEASDSMAKLELFESELRKTAEHQFKGSLIEIDKRFKALAILEDERELSATELASKLSVVESTVRRYLSFLVNEGFVEKDLTTRPYVFRFISAPWAIRVVVD